MRIRFSDKAVTAVYKIRQAMVISSSKTGVVEVAKVVTHHDRNLALLGRGSIHRKSMIIKWTVNAIFLKH